MPEAQHIDDEKRTLILTGASRGIGHATVKRFSSAGWRVITCSRHAFPENCPWAAGPEDHIQVDLADPRDTARAAEEMRSRLTDGKLHALVNNAAISPKGPKGERLGTLESSQELWRQVFEVNLFSTIWLAQGLKNELAKAHGAIVNVTSIAGSRVHPFAGAAYSISKAAAAALTREMAADFGPWGVRVNAIAPGWFITEMNDEYLTGEAGAAIKREIPMGRFGNPGDLDGALLLLTSDAGSYITGATIVVDGGQVIQIKG